MATATTITCPECGAVLRPAKPLRPGKSVKCPKCGAGFVAGGDEPARAGAPSPVQKRPAVPIAAVKQGDDDDEDGGGTYTVRGEDAGDAPLVNYAPDDSIRDLRGPAMRAVVDPSNKLIIVGATGFVGWVAVLITFSIPVLFPLQTREDREKQRAEKARDLQMKHMNLLPGAPLPPPRKEDEETSFFQIGSLDLRDVAEFRWYLLFPCFLPMVLGMIYSAVLSMGAVKIQNLESRDWGIASSVMAMVPLNVGGVLFMEALVLNICLDFLFEDLFKWVVLGFFLVCVWGVNLAVGIWMLTTLNKPDVIAGFDYISE